jgi:hypothetical protein
MDQVVIFALAVVVGLLCGLGHVSANVRMARGTWR